MKVVFFLVALFLSSAESANILGLFTSASPSHVIVYTSVAKALAAKGHNVTVVTSFPLKDKNPEYKHVLLRPDDKVFTKIQNGMTKMSNAQSGLDKFKSMVSSLVGMTQLQYDGMISAEFQTLIKSSQFDLVINGQFFNTFHLAVAAQLKVPIVLVWTSHPAGFLNTFTGNPTLGSFVPNTMVTNKQPMNFGERLKTFLANGVFGLLHDYVNYKMGQYYK